MLGKWFEDGEEISIGGWRKVARARRAVVLINHRFSTVRNADRVDILDEGRIVESGTHFALMPVAPSYRLRALCRSRACSSSMDRMSSRAWCGSYS